MGVVLKGYDRELKRLVAIKALTPHLAHTPLARKRFAREAQAAAAVVNLHVIAIHQVQPNGRLPFLVMPLLTGESLANRLKASGTMDVMEILRIGMQAAEGLAAGACPRLIHRDVKPANILLDKGVERAVLTDFGLARAADDVSLTRQGFIAGTPEYMSPEQARGEALDGRSDLFSLGCVLYEMATGVSPFRTDSTIATLRRIVEEQPASMASLVPELPPWFCCIVERLLSKDRAHRFESASEVNQVLAACLAHLQQPASVPLPPSVVSHAKVSRSFFNSTRKGILTMLGTLGMTLLGLILWQATDSPNISGDQSKEIATKLAEICRKHDVPAMSVAMLNSKGLVQSQCFGVRKRGASDKVELADRFPIGSNTKSMTATLAAVLVEAGKIEWETTIGEVWPKATDKDLHPKLRKVTLDQLLSHQGGVANNVSDLSGEAWANHFEEKLSPTSERKEMLKLVLSKAPTHPQGTFVYSNLGYAIASAMLEARTGESYESLMKKHLFDPLEMRSADFRSLQSAKQLRPPMLWGHHAATGEPVDPRTMGAENPTVYAAVGTVHMSIEDYAKYARWQLAGKPAPVLKSQSEFDHLRKPQVDHTIPGAKYGCGWICIDTPLGPALNHAGSNTNTFALIWILPEADFAAIVCANTGEKQAFPACDEMVVHLMRKYAFKKTTEPVGDQGQVTPERLVGRYQLTPNFIFDVKLKDGHLMVGITNQPTQEVFADSPTKWSYRGVNAQLEFHLRAEGLPTLLRFTKMELHKRRSEYRSLSGLR